MKSRKNRLRMSALLGSKKENGKVPNAVGDLPADQVVTPLARRHSGIAYDPLEPFPVSKTGKGDRAHPDGMQCTPSFAQPRTKNKRCLSA